MYSLYERALSNEINSPVYFIPTLGIAFLYI